MYSGEVGTFEKLTVPHPQRSRMTAGARANPSKLEELQRYPEGLQIREARPLTFKGEEAKADATGRYPVGTTGMFVVAHGGQPMVVTLVQQADGWKVDLRWWLAMTEQAAGREPVAGTPEFAVRSLLAAMLRLDRTEAARFVPAGADMTLLFSHAPRQHEPSGVLDATVFEMPLVEIEPGEFIRTPTGKIVEGVRAADRKVLVGQFGPVEMPFVLRRVGSEWRVDVEPYFDLMMQ
jgi:hypothetical protein